MLKVEGAVCFLLGTWKVWLRILGFGGVKEPER